MKQGVKRLLVPTSVGWRCVSKKFSVLYNGRWLKNMDSSNSNNGLTNINRPSTSTSTNSSRATFCCLSREDVTRFLISCLGALAPIPLSSISSLEAINPHFSFVEAPIPAIEATRKVPQDTNAVAVVELTSDGQHKIIGEISACKLWKCDYLAAAYALANLSAGQFVMGVEDTLSPRAVPEIGINSTLKGDSNSVNGTAGSTRPRKFSSRSIGFFSHAGGHALGSMRSMYRGRSAPLTCKATSSLAAVMAQILSHRATHVWVTDGEEDVLIGVVGYREILHAVTGPPPPTMS